MAKDGLVFVLALTMLLGMARLPGNAMAQNSQGDAARFYELLAEHDAVATVGGLQAGEIVLQAGAPSLVDHDSSPIVENFVASATFHEPEGLALFDIWEMGFTFRGFDHFYLDSLGFWYYAPAGGDVVANGNVPDFFDLKRAGDVTLDLVVEETRAMFGMGGTFITAFDIAPGPASPVAVSSGFYPDNQMLGIAIPYSGFQVWPLPLVGSDAETAPAPPPIDEVATDIPSAPTSVAIEPGAADYFQSLLAEQETAAPIAGPFTANLNESSGQLGLSWAGVAVADFHARAVIGIPEASEIGWSAGFTFRSSPEGDFRIGIGSQQQWYLSVGTGAPVLFGEAPQVALLPGGANGLDLMVSGQTALLGVNGDLVAIVELPAESVAADVAVATGLYADLWQEGRLTLFRDFAVLPLPADLALAGTSPASPEDTGRFLDLLAETEYVTPAVGPFTGRLVEATAGSAPTAVAGVSETDLGAMATFVNPVDPGAGPWDSGLQFRDDGQTYIRVVVDSLGDVYVSSPGEAPLLVGRSTLYDASPGGSNTLHLFVEGERALFGVNGELMAAFDIPAGGAGDILVGAAFFNEDFVAGRVTDYREFQVWGIG